MHITNENQKSEFSNVWVVAEVLSGKIQPVTHELTGSARDLADTRKSEVWVVVMGHGVSEQSLHRGTRQGQGPCPKPQTGGMLPQAFSRPNRGRFRCVPLGREGCGSRGG